MSSKEFANTKQEELASGLLTKVELFVLSTCFVMSAPYSNICEHITMNNGFSLL